MESFFDRLELRVQEVDSLLCVGLDPHPEDLDEQTAEAARDFCLRLIEATAPSAAAFKPNAAFFERFGPEGMQALKQVIAAVPLGIPVILDAKRGDIASTARAYAAAAFNVLGAGAITLNPYLGHDAIAPFLEDPGRGAFLLCKTSNPGAGDLQALRLADGVTVFERVAALAQQWNANRNLGLVVGATYPQALAQVRKQAPDLWFLSPGVGAQGADLEAALSAGLRADGLGMLVNVSRSLSRADDPGAAAGALAIAINKVRRQPGENNVAAALNSTQAALADGLLQSGCIRFGEFTLKSGLQSPIYLDLRRLVGNPALLAQAAVAYRELLAGMQFDRLAALPYAALPIATAISLQSGWPLIYPRKEIKEYGTKAAVEGPYEPGERVVVIDDLATTGGSKFEAIEKLAAAGLQVKDVVVLVDRQSGAAQALALAGYNLHAVMPLGALLDYWEQKATVAADQIGRVRRFLAEV